jgi:hypothetical protein
MTYFTKEHQKTACAITDQLDQAKSLAANRTAVLFPIGSLVFVESSGRRFTMRVERHGSVWCEPTTVYGVNVKTGKQRRFYLGCDRVLRVDLPKKAARK